MLKTYCDGHFIVQRSTCMSCSGISVKLQYLLNESDTVGQLIRSMKRNATLKTWHVDEAFAP